MRASQTHIDSTLDLPGMKNAEPPATTWATTIVKTVPDMPLSSEEHSVYRTAVGKLLWCALVDKRAESGCDCPDKAECR